MNLPWPLSTDYRRSLAETQSYKYSWDESNPKRLSHKLYQITHRLREGLENPTPLQLGSALCSPLWLMLGVPAKPFRGHSGQTLLAVSNTHPSGSAWPPRMGPLLINQTGFSPPCSSPGMRSGGLFITEFAEQLSALLSVSLLKGGWWGKCGCETTVTHSLYLFSQHREKGLPRMRVKNSWFALEGVFTLKHRKQV